MRRSALVIGLVALATGFVPATASLVEPTPQVPDDGVEPALMMPGPPARLQVEAEPEATITRIRQHLEAGDAQRALRTARRFVSDHEWGRDRDAAWLVIGLLERDAGRHNLASEAFTRVRSSTGPLAPWGAYHEAEEDLARGRQWVVIKECERYRQTWPTGKHAGDCLRLTAIAQAELGRSISARQAAAEYDEEHENGHISEQIDLLLARQEAGANPEGAVRPLQALAITHEAPLTGRVAEELLAELASQGIDASLPDDPNARIARAVSLRDAKRRDEAWALFQQLAQEGDDDPTVAGFVEDQAERFGWRTHQWDFLADWYADVYATEGRPEDAWSRYRVLDRGGRFGEAADFALEMQQKLGGSREWRHSQEDVGRTMMLAGRYEEARAQFDAVAGRGGWTGRRGAFYAAFASLMASDAEDAVARFDAILKQDRSWVIESHYWRARALDALERPVDAGVDRDWILQNEPWSWYGALVRQSLGQAPLDPPLARSGRWVGQPAPSLALPDPAQHEHVLPTATRPIPVGLPVAGTPLPPPSGLASLSWPWDTTATMSVVSPVPTPPPFDPERNPPASYRSGALWNDETGRAALYRFAERHKTRWPELGAIHDLASVGLYDLSGPLMSEWYETWREDYRRGRADAREVGWLTPEAWRTLFLAAHDHHHAARFSYGLWEDVEDESLQLEAWRLAYPLAHDQVVWEASRTYGIDPYLVLGLMRQESTYNAMAVSRVGARGAMQIMPRTGHLLANLTHDTEFTSGDLEDPVLSVQYGIRYLGLLMHRFDDSFPLAVASYNGGPFNVSTWLAGTGPDLPMDAFVEHIPFRETRDYVKRVSGGYAAYVTLYGPVGSDVVIPTHPAGDHPEVVDF